MSSDSSSKAQSFVKALPLVLWDLGSTATAYIVGAWGTHVLDELIATSDFVSYVTFLAVVNVVVFACCKMYTSLWQYASVNEMTRIVLAVVLASVIGDVASAFLFGQRLPYRVCGVGAIMLLVLVGAGRFAVRVYAEKNSVALFGGHEDNGLPRSLIVGAGKTGSLTVRRMLANDPDMQGFPVGLVDDDAKKQGTYVHGKKVVGSCDDIPNLCESERIDQIVLAIPSSTKAERDRIYGICMKTGVKTLTLPLIHDLPQGLDGKIALREVEISDLLARDENVLDIAQMGYVTDKCVLVTGGGGSIGSELVRQLLPAKPAKIVLFDIYENTTYELFHEISKEAAEDGVELAVEIGSITHMPALEKCFNQHDPHVVFHAAAHKHVPLMENNPRVEQVIIRHNFGSCLLNTIKAQLDNGFELVSNKPKCAFGRKGRDSVLSAASMMVAA